ncbi:hypothetical protein EJB05_30311 [Eragrostis curvula]|uniref:Uncharacterized protein n=1 Tax=Eragrostis curvula TaxID=38414 RepID=A0A5J9UBI6_9POAL|nr:hypothetical protein EJB05_30311 [Eragrostis curvula]
MLIVILFYNCTYNFYYECCIKLLICVKKMVCKKCKVSQNAECRRCLFFCLAPSLQIQLRIFIAQYYQQQWLAVNGLKAQSGFRNFAILRSYIEFRLIEVLPCCALYLY